VGRYDQEVLKGIDVVIQSEAASVGGLLFLSHATPTSGLKVLIARGRERGWKL
jgi:hypothetical protein